MARDLNYAFVLSGLLAGCAVNSHDSGTREDELGMVVGDNGSRTASPSRVTGEKVLPNQGCPDVYEERIEAPSLCAWVTSLDLLILGTVESRSARPLQYALNSGQIEALKVAAEALEVSDEFPWLDRLASNSDGANYELVDSCPDGLSAKNADWELHVRVTPSMAITVRTEEVLYGDADVPSPTFHVGSDQYNHWDGPKLSDSGGWEGPQLAVGGFIGVGLTYDALGNFTLGTHGPFGVDDQGKVNAEPTDCTPLMTAELNGMQLDDLREAIRGCRSDQEAVEAGRSLHDDRVSLVSGPENFPVSAASCGIILHSSSADE